MFPSNNVKTYIKEMFTVAFSVGGKQSGSILPFDACFWNFR